MGENGLAAAVDPAAGAQEYLRLLEQEGARLTHILLTHGHYDHVGAVEELQRKTGAKVWLAPQDACGGELFPFTTPDNAYADGEEIRVDTDLAFRVIATPGHSAGSVCLLCGGLLFSGDTLFAGDVGRTDLPGGSWDTLRKSLKKLCAAVTENVQVLPGHEEFSTMDREQSVSAILTKKIGINHMEIYIRGLASGYASMWRGCFSARAAGETVAHGRTPCGAAGQKRFCMRRAHERPASCALRRWRRTRRPEQAEYEICRLLALLLRATAAARPGAC